MATREGIYVGGKDIIERYVGTRLVWSKWVYVGYYQNLRTPYDSQGYLIFDSISSSGFNDKYRDESRVKDVKVRIQHRNDTITTVYAKYARLYDRNTGQDNYRRGKSLYISFKDDNQKQVFKSNFANGDSLFFYFK
ncbi:hypothetical protein [Streptococcus mitis]|jgi:hypothetical protein|uniref:Uncharacterized protein n=1 Tax=Streptococcus mitis TaxID=28037 RepID=A0A1X1JTM9_STRMT|nr:hypothetical protein [Streptococcus mitis]DAK49186.1 MAG TPA: hypothetical protein [Caudoviricetes sp.]MBT2174542.1 hypothetical protein [Streptococcus mitis]MBT2174614.1 hypothetical protein [Streptococcus mitis]ORO90449.1 hypothetical protein B7702_01990 [Streptococcus mitis]ORO90571.1 hypothetical protein B7702_02635 [Streptococcus mitis]